MKTSTRLIAEIELGSTRAVKVLASPGGNFPILLVTSYSGGSGERAPTFRQFGMLPREARALARALLNAVDEAEASQARKVSP